MDFLSNIVVKERRKRQALERRTKELERLSRQAVKHYDARFIELASEVCNCVDDRSKIASIDLFSKAPLVLAV